MPSKESEWRFIRVKADGTLAFNMSQPRGDQVARDPGYGWDVLVDCEHLWVGRSPAPNGGGFEYVFFIEESLIDA